MDEQIAQQLGVGALCLIIGLSGWLLPYRWNLLRLRRGLAGLVSDNVNQLIPKVVGSILILVGLLILIGSTAVGNFQ